MSQALLLVPRGSQDGSWRYLSCRLITHVSSSSSLCGVSVSKRPFFIRTQITSGEGPLECLCVNAMTSVKNPFPVRSHSEDVGTELQHTNLGRTQFNPEQKAAENFKLRRCVGNHPSAEGRGTAVLPSSSLGHGPGRTQKGGLSWLHGVREPAEKFCQLDGGLRGWVPGPTRGCLRAHAWALLLAVGWGFLTPRPPRGCRPVCRSGFRRQVSQGPAEAGQPRRPCGVFPATHRPSGGVPSRLSTSPAPGENVRLHALL